MCSIVYGDSRYGIFKLLRGQRVSSKESIPPAYVATAGQYDNPIPTQFLAPIDCSKMPALESEEETRKKEEKVERKRAARFGKC